MQRILEPELMDDPEQAHAYAMADFSEPDSQFISLFREEFGPNITGLVLDLGCGPGNISFRFVKAYPGCVLHAIDGSSEMIRLAKALLSKEEELTKRLSFIKGILPDIESPRKSYDVIICNSLLHHLHNPMVLWDTIKRFSGDGTIVFIRDLTRPDSKEEARRIVETYSGGEPDILKRDFYNSLLASFTEDEVRKQLLKAGLNHLRVRSVSDRHMVISGKILIFQHCGQKGYHPD